MPAPQQPQPAGRPADKSLQINIDSEDDAKAVIQHLPLIRKTWDTLADTAGINSVEFCIAETIKKKVDGILIGAINWCRTYVKAVMPFEGNVHFPLPHYVPVPKRPVEQCPASEVSSCPVPVAPKQNRYLKNLATTPDSPLVKPERPVPAPAAST